MPVEAIVNRPPDIACRPLGVGELPAEVAALLLEGPRAGPPPHQFPTNRGVVTPYGGQVPLGAVQIRPDPLHLLQAAVLLGRQGLACGLVVLQVTPQALKAVGVPPRGVESRAHGGASPCTWAPRVWVLTRVAAAMCIKSDV